MIRVCCKYISLNLIARLFNQVTVAMPTQCVLTASRPSVNSGSASHRASAALMMVMGPAALMLLLLLAAIFCGSYLFQAHRFGIGSSFILAKHQLLPTAAELAAFPQAIDHQAVMQFIRRYSPITIGLPCASDLLFACSTPAIPEKRYVRAAHWRLTRSPPIRVMSCRAPAGQGRDVVPVWTQPCPR